MLKKSKFLYKKGNSNIKILHFLKKINELFHNFKKNYDYKKMNKELPCLLQRTPRYHL